jgi:hypothetical protein
VKRFVAPSEDEWVAYTRQTWTDWPEHDVRSSWGSYQGRGWHGVKDWKACAKTCYHRQAGRQQPKPAERQRALVGAHAAPARSIDDAPEEIREISRRIAAREDVSDDDGARLGRWMRGEG